MLASVDGGPQEKATVVEEPEDLLELATECRRRLKGLLHAVYCYSDDQPKSSVASGTPSDCDDEVDQVLEERYEHHMDTIERSCGLEDLHAYLLVFGPCLELQQSPVSCGISLMRYLRYQLDLLHAARVASGELSQKAEEHRTRRPLSALQELCILPHPSEVEANPDPEAQSSHVEQLDEDTTGGDGVCLPPVCEPPVVPREPLESDLMLELLNDHDGGDGGLSTGAPLHCTSNFLITSRLWPPRGGPSSSSAAAAAGHSATSASLIPRSPLPGTAHAPPDDASSSYTPPPGSMAQEQDTLQLLSRREQVHQMLDEKLNPLSDTKPPMGGVCYDNCSKAWIAYWTERKSLRSKRFKVRDFGFEQARLQAIQCRRYWGRNRRKATVLAPADRLSAAGTPSSLHSGLQVCTGSLISERQQLARGESSSSSHRMDGRPTVPAPNIYSFLGAFEGTSQPALESRPSTMLDDATPSKWSAEDDIVRRRPSSIDTGQLTDDGRRALSRGIKMAELYGESDSTDDFVDESAVEELEEDGACEWQNSDDEDDYSCYAAAEAGRAEEEEEDVQRGPAYHHSFSIGKGVRYSTFSDTWVGDMMFRGRRLTQHFAVKKLGWEGAKASAIKWRQDMETLASQSR